MDEADRAQIAEQHLRELSLQRLQAPKAAPLKRQADGYYHCQDCDGEVPDLRVHAIGATRCLECQQAHEKAGGRR